MKPTHSASSFCFSSNLNVCGSITLGLTQKKQVTILLEMLRCVCVLCRCMCTCMWRTKVDVRCFSPLLMTVFLRQLFHWTCHSQIWLDWLAGTSCPQLHTCTAVPGSLEVKMLIQRSCLKIRPGFCHGTTEFPKTRSNEVPLNKNLSTPTLTGPRDLIFATYWVLFIESPLRSYINWTK